MVDKSVVGPLLLGAAITGATGLCLYLLLRKEEEQLRESRLGNLQKEHLEVWIDEEHLGVVLGRHGSNIREIQSRTNTTIWLKETTDTGRSKFSIIGRPEDTHLAEILIHQTISSKPRLESCVLNIPSSAVQSILGKSNENLRSLELKSRCKIELDQRGENGQVRLTLNGTKDQIEVGREIVELKLQEHLYILNKISNKARGGPQRVGYDQPLFLKYDQEEEEHHHTKVLQESLRCTGSDQLVQVYVSCVAHPGRFWVQNVGPSSIELDKLTQDMTQYYSNPDNQAFHSLETVTVGDIVVASFSADSNFYRAKVVVVNTEEYDVSKSMVDLDFIDFGDWEVKPLSEVYEIRSEYLKLNFQAVLCKLAHVRSPDHGAWSEESIGEFERLTHCAQWKPVLAKIEQTLEKSAEDCPENISPVQLFVTSQSGEKSVGEELVRQGLAEFNK